MKKFNWYLQVTPIIILVLAFIIRKNKINADIFAFDFFIISLFAALPLGLFFLIYLFLLYKGRKKGNMIIVNILNMVFLTIAVVLLIYTMLLPSSNFDAILEKGDGEESFAQILFERVKKMNTDKNTLFLTNYSFKKQEGNGAFMDADSSLIANLKIEIRSGNQKIKDVELQLECLDFDYCYKTKGELKFKD